MHFRQGIQSHLPLWPSLLVGVLLCFSNGGNARAGDAVESVGDILQYVLPATAAGVTIVHKDGQGAWQWAGSTALAMGVTYALKYTVDETRPEGGSYSFPSAHTSISFSSAEFLRKRYGWSYGLPAYAAATFVGYSRVESGEHYTHDVIAGAVIGVASSYLLTTPFQRWRIQPDLSRKYFGIRIAGHW